MQEVELPAKGHDAYPSREPITYPTPGHVPYTNPEPNPGPSPYPTPTPTT